MFNDNDMGKHGPSLSLPDGIQGRRHLKRRERRALGAVLEFESDY